MATLIEYEAPVLLDSAWQWVYRPIAHPNSWMLGWTKSPSILYAAVQRTSGPTWGIVYVPMCRNSDGPESWVEKLECACDTLTEAMRVAETHLVFIMKDV